MRRILAITFDGLLQPLGYSQVARVLMGLSRLGFEYTVLSLERERHLRDREHVARVSESLREAGIAWVYIPYDEQGGARSIALNVQRAWTTARRLSSSVRFDLVHARAVHATIVARALRAFRGIPYVFDARGYWVDEQVEEGRRFRTPAAYGAAKAVERRLFTDAAGIVTLTELQADDARSGALGPLRGRPVVCIPTCADYEEFRPCRPDATRPSILAGLPPSARTFGIVGSINRSYLVRETLELARLVSELDSSVHIVVLSEQADEYGRRLREMKISMNRVSIASAPHHAMPSVLPHLEWAPLLLAQNFAKRASMPTKLAEFFASGVRVAQFGCNPEVSRWVEQAGNGFVLRDVSASGLQAAAERVVSWSRNRSDAERARERTASHFSLVSGIRRYAEDVIRPIFEDASSVSGATRSSLPPSDTYNRRTGKTDAGVR